MAKKGDSRHHIQNRPAPLPPPPRPPPLYDSGDPFSFHQHFQQFMSAHTTWLRQLKSNYPSQFLQEERSQSRVKERTGVVGVTKRNGISRELRALVGDAPMTKGEIAKQLWTYIKKNKLLDPSDKGKVICDEALRAVFDTDSFDMSQLNTMLAKHVLLLDPANESVSSVQNKGFRSRSPTPSVVSAARKTVDGSSRSGAERAKGAGSVEKVHHVSPELEASVPYKRQKMDVQDGAELLERGSAIKISHALSLFLGTPTREMLPSEATQRVLEYVKAKISEDPSSMAVVCDSKLRELFGHDTVSILKIKDLLASNHFFQSS